MAANGADLPSQPSAKRARTGTGLMQLCFEINVRSESIKKFVKIHEAIWPEYQQVLHRHGLRNFALYCHPEGHIVGYFEGEVGFKETWTRVRREEVHAKWREHVKAATDGVDVDSIRELQHYISLCPSEEEKQGTEVREERLSQDTFQVQDWTGGGGLTKAGLRRVCFRGNLEVEVLKKYFKEREDTSGELGAREAVGWRRHALFCNEDGLAVGFFEEPAGESLWREVLKPYPASLVESAGLLRPCAYLGADRARARVAVAGAGWWSQGWHLPMLERNSDSEIAAIIEPVAAPRSTLNKDMKTTKELGELYSVPIFNTIDEFLASDVASNTHGIVVASSHATHAEIGLKALGAGLHVLMEKPMTTDPKEASDLARAAAKSDKLFMVNNTANFREQSKRIRELVQGGEIGTLHHVSAYMGAALLWLFDNPENAGWVKPSGTMLGNGFGWGQMSHVFAWVYYVTELVPRTVFCHMVPAEKTGADIFDSALIRCACGATISVQGVAALPFGSYTGTGKQVENRIFGSEGHLSYGGDDGAGSVEGRPESGSLVLRRHDGKDLTVPGFLFENYASEGSGPESLREFIGGCVGRGVRNCADATVGARAVQTIDAMYRSAQSGRAEEVIAE